MNVPWYYAVNGERKGPLSWNQILTAVQEGRLSPEHYIWSPAFGTAWRKAGTLTGLFPPPEGPPPTMPPNDAEPGPPPLEKELEAMIEADTPVSPFAETPSTDETAPGAGPLEGVQCLKSLSRAWTHATRMLFTAFAFRRWFFLSLCVMLTQLNPPNPIAGLLSGNTDERTARHIDRLGLQTVAESGIFNWSLPVDPAGRPELGGEGASDWPARLGGAMRDTAVATQAWMTHRGHRMHVITLLGVIVLVYAIGIWFTSRGHAMLLSRLYRPDALIFSTWIEADRAAKVLFKGMMIIRLVSILIFTLALHHAISALAALPADVAVPNAHVFSMLRTFTLIIVADQIIMGFVRDFVTPHLVLGTPRFSNAFTLALSQTGLWYIRYLLLLFAAYSLLVMLLSLSLPIFGMALMMVFLSPLVGAMLTLPLHLLRRLWTLDIVFQLNPGLRSAVPKNRLIRIIK